MLSAQKGACAICYRLPTDELLHIDHCHDSKQVRGLLCRACNTAIGMLGHDRAILARAIVYLGSQVD
jgi:hypothetical protein